ncbi:MAG: VanZ family protein [Deltaproteobacteria bacterium]|nr:VanZ family protein [Deltaproteobacteria bacterium]
MPAPEKWRQKQFLSVYVVPLLLYCLIIFWLSALSDPGRLSPFSVPDKIAHLLEYTVFGFLLMRMLTYLRPERDVVQHLIWVLSGALIYGLSDEIHQYFVPGREFSWMDLLADGAGGYLGARLWMIFSKRGKYD